MKSNIEIKAKVIDPDKLETLVLENYSTDSQILNQKEIYYRVNNGRLKLRIFSENEGELIFYEREDSLQPKKSHYSIYRTAEPQNLNEVLKSCHGILGVVDNTRKVYIKRQTRIHLDSVKDLGSFMELEVILDEGRAEKEGVLVASENMNTLGIRDSDLISGSYIDLVLKNNETSQIEN